MNTGRKLSFRTRFRQHWVRWTILGTIAFVIFNIATVEFTSQSFFCNSCHIMNPFYNSWKEGKHAEVECIKCHIPPGVNSYAMAKLNGLGQVVDDLLHRTSTKPSAAVSAFTCTRAGCHNPDKIKQADLRANRNPQDRPYLFNHEKHVDNTILGIKINCTTCHSHIKIGNHFEVNTNVCVSCHMIATDTPATLAQKEKQTATLVGKSFSSRIIFQPRRVEHVEEVLPSREHNDKSVPTVTVPPSVGSNQNTPQAIIALTSSPQKPDATHPNQISSAELKPPYRCRTCHTPPSQIVEYRGLEIDHRDFVTFGTTCESCHSGITAIPRVIDDTQCLSCHDFGAERVTGTLEVHDLHSSGEHKVECFACHGITKHGPSAQSIRLERLNCTNCHERQHLVQFDTYTSLEHKNTLGSQHEKLPAVSPMLLVHVDCSGCHVRRIQKPDGSAVIVAAPEACDTCHQTGFGEKMIPLWQNATHQLYDEVRKQYDDTLLHNGFNPEAKSHLKKSEDLLNLVKFDGSWGVHNPQYTKRLLLSARDELTQAQNIKNTHNNSWIP